MKSIIGALGRFGLSKNSLAMAIAITFACTSHAGLQITNEYWVSARTDNPTNALGTLDDPYDGSTSTKFDTLMSNMPSNSTVHILAGTYTTLGNQGWFAKTGQKILGSGMGITTLRLVSGAVDTSYLIGNWFLNYDQNIEVSDMTLDCNYTSGSYTYAGVALFGSRHAIRRVRVVNAVGLSGSAPNPECFPISINATPGYNSEGNVIEECEVSQFKGGLYSAIALDGSSYGGTTNWISGTMSRNTILMNAGFGQAINGAWMVNSVISDNYVSLFGSTTGFYGDTGHYTNVVVANNTFRGCLYGVLMQTASGLSSNYRENISFIYNNFDVTNAAGTAFSLGGSGSVFRNITIKGNNIRYFDGGSGSGGHVIDANNLTGLTMSENHVDATMGSLFTSCTNLNISDNYDMYGNRLNGLIYKKMTPFTVSYTAIDGKVTGSYSMLTVPTNLNFIVTSMAFETVEKTGSFTAGVQSSLGSGTALAGICTNVGSGTTLTAGTFQLRTPKSDALVLTNGETLTFRVGTAATGGTKWTVNAHVTGFYR